MHNAAGDGVLIRDNQLIRPFPAGLATGSALPLPGPGSTVWQLPSQTNDTIGPQAITLHRLDGSTVADATIHLPASAGSLSSDQNGYLLENMAGHIYLHTPDAVSQIATGNLIATGVQHLLTWTCDTHAQCTLNLIDRANGHRSVIPAQNALKALNDDVVTGDGGNLVSPGGRRAVLDGYGSTFSRTVIDLADGRAHVLPGSTTQFNPSSQTSWTANSSWLLTLTDGRLRTYDTQTGQTRTLPVSSAPLIHLAVS